MRLREKLLTALLLAPLAGTSAWAKERGNFDAFLARQEARGLAAGDAELQARGARVEHIEERLGVPTVLWNARAGSERSGALAGQRPEQAARGHLQQFADLYRLTREELSNAVLHSVHKPDFGPVVARFEQKVDGIEVFRGGVNVVMDRNNELVAITGYLAPRDAVAARSRTAGTEFRLSAAEALARAFQDLTDTALSGRSLVASGTQGDFTRFSFEPGVATVLPHAMASPARAKKIYFTLPDGLQPAWYVELNVGTKGSDDSDYYSYIVSATDGALLFRNNLTVEDSFSYRVWADSTSYIPFDGPHGNDATPHPTGEPDRYQEPLDNTPSLITLQNVPFSRNDPWLPPNSTQTTGNNVEAYADLGAPDGFQPETDLRADVTAPGVFDYTYDVTQAPGASVEQRKAAVAHLFYVNNFLHDWFYDAGFDEASGNAQAFNYGRGGLEGDSLKAEAQDYGGRNNANMSTPADGSRPRMQMYVFNGVPELRVTAPAGLVGVVEAGSAGFGSQNFDLSGDLAILDPAGVTLGCEAFPAGTFDGKIALLDRGTCTFTSKVKNAQNAGAIGVVIANNTAGQPAPGLGGSDSTVTLPAMSVTLETGNAWKAEVQANSSTLTVKMKRTPDLDRDGTLDNAIVAHEWGHYISNRLIGNGNGLTNNQGRAMGEGWADFHAMLMVVRDEDRLKAGNEQFQGVYAMAGYTQSGGANNGHYFGIRRIPYSTAFEKNALTYKHFAGGNPLPDTHPVSGNTNGRGNSQVHNGGEVWATMLWECYASLLNAYPFQEAQDRMKQYLVAAYKATPSSPTLLEARDALLAVAAASDPADYARFAQAFARRGAGFGAKAADRDAVDHVGLEESFETGSNLEVVSIHLDDSAVGCDQDGVLDMGETGVLSVTVRNTGSTSLPALTGTVVPSQATATLTLPDGETLSFPSLPRFGTATRTLRVGLSATTGTAPRAGLTVTFNEDSLPAGAKTAIYDGRVHYDEVLGASARDDFEGQLNAWTSTLVNRVPGWKPATSKEQDGALRRYLHVANQPIASEVVLTSPWLKVNPEGNFVMSFKYRHSLEGTVGGSGPGAPWYDGVVLEFSVDGVNWMDSFQAFGVNPGYAGFLAETENPLSGRPAYVGMNALFPGWSTANLDFKTAFAGKDLRVRLRIGADGAVGAHGFDIDEVQFTNIANTPFAALVGETSDGTVCNRRPVADVGQAVRSVAEFVSSGGTMVRQTVTLNGTGSYDPDGQSLTYAWTQVAGPAITLDNADTATPSFLADVPANTTYVFQLVVSDGTDSSLPKTAEVTVTNVNRKPVAVPTGPGSVAERSTPTIALDGSGSSDEDGEPLTYSWTQIDNGAPPVGLSNPTSSKPSFATPEVPADTQFAFSLVVNDGYEDSAPMTVAVTVSNVDRAPIAEAGMDFEVSARESAKLQGSGSDPDGDAITYAWTQVEGTAVTLTGADTATPSFTAPDVREPTTLVFQLVVTANGLSSAQDLVTLTVRKANRRPVGQGPASFEEEEGTIVTLDASQSSDPDGDTLTYQWTQTGGPLVTLTGQGTAQLQFTAPEVAADTLMSFRLVVSDPDGTESEPSTVSLKVLHVNKAPVAQPRKLSGQRTGETFTLDGATSRDPDGEALTYQWEQASGPEVTLSSTTEATVTFEAPDVQGNTPLVFKLTVTDPSGAAASQTVEVTVEPKPADESGCSSTGSGSGSVMLLALLAGVLLSRRREPIRG